MLKPNEDKNLTINYKNKTYERLPIKTHLILDHDNLLDVVDKYAKDHLQDGDVFFITEKIVAIVQGRSYELEDIKVRPLANLLSKFVVKTPYGIGLGMPETMEMALREVGTPRILLAAGVSAITKLFGRKGEFYNVAGYKARAIDGPTDGTIPPFDNRVVIAPKDPEKVAKEVKEHLDKDITVLIADINDLDGNILASTDNPEKNDEYVAILKDNPLGQLNQSTPMGIIREVKQIQSLT